MTATDVTALPDDEQPDGRKPPRRTMLTQP
jgi:hypothetical protein